jgi:hypothetical protein
MRLRYFCSPLGSSTLQYDQTSIGACDLPHRSAAEPAIRLATYGRGVRYDHDWGQHSTDDWTRRARSGAGAKEITPHHPNGLCACGAHGLDLGGLHFCPVAHLGEQFGRYATYPFRRLYPLEIYVVTIGGSLDASRYTTPSLVMQFHIFHCPENLSGFVQTYYATRQDAGLSRAGQLARKGDRSIRLDVGQVCVVA